MNSKDLHNLIDSCRPGHDDVDQPEMSALAEELSRDPSLQSLFDRSQKLDEGIRSAFQAVTPPPGLAQRLLDAIETPAVELDAESTPLAEIEPRVEPARPRSRRPFGMWASVASLVAVAAAITLWLQWPPAVSLSSSDREIAEIVDRWNSELDAGPWQTTANIPADEFPSWQHLELNSVDRWQWVGNRQIVSYDFAIHHGAGAGSEKKVRLFVIKPSNPMALPTAPPLGYPSPDGWHVGAWQANDRVYYLAVYAQDNSKGLYSQVIASPYSAT